MGGVMKKEDEANASDKIRLRGSHAKYGYAWLWVFSLCLFWSESAHASFFKGETLDAIADVMTWVVLVVAPVVGIAVFLLIHILPEKIAEKKQHPQAKAIQVLCLLSLVFGGMLWPLAWLWAYTKPVLYRMAYGVDKAAHGHDEADTPPAGGDEAEELKRLRRRVAELETNLGSNPAAEEGKA